MTADRGGFLDYVSGCCDVGSRTLSLSHLLLVNFIFRIFNLRFSVQYTSMNQIRVFEISNFGN